MTDILVFGIEGEAARGLDAVLSAEGCSLTLASGAEEALEIARAGKVALALLDMEAPGAEALARDLKDADASLPLLALVPPAGLAGGDPILGADDFLVKPWRPQELRLRARRILARRQGLDGRDILMQGDLVLDQARYQVWVAGRPVDLTYMEYNLLRFLASNPGRVFTREALLERVWGYDYLGGSRTVDVHVRRLRSKIEDQHHSFIETVRNVGYRFKASPAAPL